MLALNSLLQLLTPSSPDFGQQPPPPPRGVPLFPFLLADLALSGVLNAASLFLLLTALSCNSGRHGHSCHHISLGSTSIQARFPSMGAGPGSHLLLSPCHNLLPQWLELQFAPLAVRACSLHWWKVVGKLLAQ